MKYITRTVTTYTYIYGRFNPTDGTFEIIYTETLGYKAGKRDIAKIEKAKNAHLLHTEENQKLYGMSMDLFLANAEPMEMDEDDTDGEEKTSD